MSLTTAQGQRIETLVQEARANHWGMVQWTVSRDEEHDGHVFVEIVAEVAKLTSITEHVVDEDGACCGGECSTPADKSAIVGDNQGGGGGGG